MDIASVLDDNSEITINSVLGINYVRPPTLNFKKIKETNDYTEYIVITKKNSNKIEGDNPLTNHLNSFTFCNETITLKVPKKSFNAIVKGLAFIKSCGIADSISRVAIFSLMALSIL